MEFDSEEEREIFGRDEEEEIESNFSSDHNEAEYLNVQDDFSESNQLVSLATSHAADLHVYSTSTSTETTPPISEKDFFNDNGSNFINTASDFLTATPTDPVDPITFTRIISQESSSSSGEESPAHSLTREDPSSGPSDDHSSNEELEVVSDINNESSNGTTDVAVVMDRVSITKTTNTSNITRPPAKKHSRRCGDCSACVIETDCGVCRFCRDMKKHGGPNKLRQKCIRRQCVKMSRVLYVDDPLRVTHGQVQLQEDIKTELERVSALPMRADAVKVGMGNRPPGSKSNTADIIAQSLIQQHKPAAGKVMKKSTVKKAPSKKQADSKKKVSTGSKRPRGGGTLADSDSDSGGVAYYQPRSTRRRPLIENWSQSSSRGCDQRQCEGPECVYVARPNSKYCSNECGVQLAMRRIETFLPKQKELWKDSNEPQASVANKEKLLQFKKDQEHITEQLKALDHQTSLINEHVAKMKQVVPLKTEDEDDECDDITVHCATCSQVIGLKKAQIHMERCFNRLEGMVSFGSIVKNEGTDIFCDKYDRSQGTYCKRLRVLCPEHTKEPKVGAHDVCGCPMEATFPKELSVSKRYCRQLKKLCYRHYSWEKLRRAEIDQEKLNLFLKQEELNEHTRLLQWQLNYRGSLVPILLHHTVNH